MRFVMFRVIKCTSTPHLLGRRIQLQQHRFCSKSKTEWKERIFSGIQPTGTLHIGNYFGAVRNWVKLQDAGKNVIFSIVDLHSITLPQDPKFLSDSIHDMAASLLACGISPSASILFQQSKIGEHTQLGWVLGCLVTLTRLRHFPQFKEKTASLQDFPLGLFVYPVLQAADILLYKATHVPVGEDQVQHIHLAQHLVHTFNNKYAPLFPVPEILLNSGGRIKSLREPEKKMSKSHADPRSRIGITDSTDEIVAKIKKAVTDCKSQVTYEPASRPGVSNLVDIHALASGKTQEEICEENDYLDTGRYKKVVAEVLIAELAPIREEYLRLKADRRLVEDILESGAVKAKAIAEETWAQVSQAVGFHSLFESDNALLRRLSKPM